MKDEIKQFHVSYWMNVFNAAIFISIVSGYQTFSQDILKGKYKYPASDLNLSLIVPLSMFIIFVAPVGRAIDKIGKRMAFNLFNFSILMLNRFQDVYFDSQTTAIIVLIV
jgi:hypothetical protein